jgi:hypothetical protein
MFVSRTVRAVQKEEKVEISIEDFNGKVYRGSRDFIRIIRSIDRENNNSIGKVSTIEIS